MSENDRAKRKKFDFMEMKQYATHADIAVRKKTFVEYFERFGEFPSYLFDNDTEVDDRLFETIVALQKDPDSTPELLKGLKALLARLPSRDS